MDKPSIEKLIDQRVLVRIIAINEKQPCFVTIRAVEAAGIWVETQSLTEDVLAVAKQSAAPRTLVVFVPFSGVSWILSSMDLPSLSEKLGA